MPVALVAAVLATKRSSTWPPPRECARSLDRLCRQRALGSKHLVAVSRPTMGHCLMLSPSAFVVLLVFVGEMYRYENPAATWPILPPASSR